MATAQRLDCLNFDAEEAFATMKKEKVLRGSMLNRASKEFEWCESRLKLLGHAITTDSHFISQREALK